MKRGWKSWKGFTEQGTPRNIAMQQHKNQACEDVFLGVKTTAEFWGPVCTARVSTLLTSGQPPGSWHRVGGEGQGEKKTGHLQFLRSPESPAPRHCHFRPRFPRPSPAETSRQRAVQQRRYPELGRACREGAGSSAAGRGTWRGGPFGAGAAAPCAWRARGGPPGAARPRAPGRCRRRRRAREGRTGKYEEVKSDDSDDRSSSSIPSKA